MYEDVTYEEILSRMLDNVPDGIDKREGSIIYTALAPCAIEVQKMYMELQVLMDETFADTASKQYLMKRAEERGLFLEEATYATVKGSFTPITIDVIDKRFNLGDLNYVVTEKIADGVYMLRCESEGLQGNLTEGQLIPIEYVDGLETANIIELLIPGEDEETTEHLRQRYFDSLNPSAFGGNIADYRIKVGAIDGVGGVKVYPVWNGGGTVKLVIISSDYTVPSNALIDSVQTAVDPVQNHGEGVGIAPIGHVVTVDGVSTETVNISTNITFAAGWTWEDVKESAKNAVDTYFHELSQGWDKEDTVIVRISQIETRFLNLAGIVDVYDTTLNSIGQNLVLSQDNIPIRGDVNG